jgi:hypothetical protein
MPNLKLVHRLQLRRLCRRNNPEQMQAKEVKGCTDVRQNPFAAQAWSGPVEGTGAHSGKGKNFGTTGYGFITMEVRQLLDECQLVG